MIHHRTLATPGARRWGCVCLAALFLLHSPAAAEDERNRWTFSLGGGVLSTFDDIRSNAAVLSLTDYDGTPGDISDDSVTPGSVDQRQDDLLGRETSAEESQTFNLGVSYGLTPWLSLQVDLGYYRGNVSNLDTFRIDQRYIDDNFDNVYDLRHRTPFHDASVPISVGELQQVPLTFSAIFRFRRDSPFNPILGAGVGWVFTNLEESQAFADLNAEILRGLQRTQFSGGTLSNLQRITDVNGTQVVESDCSLPAKRLGSGFELLACAKGYAFLEAAIQAAKDEGTYYPGLEEELYQQFAEPLNATFIPTRPLVTAEVDDGFAYQLTGGAEYHFNDRWSVYMLGRYLATKATLRVRISDNGNLFTARPTDPGTETVQPVMFNLKEALIEFNAEGNLEPPLTQQGATLDDEIFIQGGDINLSSFSLIFGLRYTF